MQHYHITIPIDPLTDQPESPEIDREALPIGEQIGDEIRCYKSWKTPLGNLIAARLETLLEEVVATGATTVDEFESRSEILDSWFVPPAREEVFA